MNMLCKLFGHAWEYEHATSLNQRRRVAVRRCRRCDYVEYRALDPVGAPVWKPGRLVTK